MKKILISILFLLPFLVLGQSNETSVRQKIEDAYDPGILRRVTIGMQKEALDELTKYAAQRTPFLTMAQVRAGKADTAQVVDVLNNRRVWKFRYVAGSTAADDSARVINVSGRRYIIESNIYEPAMYGAIGNGITDDTQALKKMMQSLDSNSVVDFGQGTYLFSYLTIPLKRNITITGKGAILKGGLHAGTKVYVPGVGQFQNSGLTIKDIKIDLSARPDSNHITISMIGGLIITGVTFKGGNAANYIYPIDIVHHSSRVRIDNCSVELDFTKPGHLRGVNYFLYIDNVNKGYDTKTVIGDYRVSNNLDVTANKANIEGWGVDGISITDNTFFMCGAFYRSQLKSYNIHISTLYWAIISDNNLFESGKESVLLENVNAIQVANNNIAWPGQRDANSGYGVRIVGPSPNNTVGYSNFIISGNHINQPSRTGIKIDSLINHGVVSGNQILSAGGIAFYYGTGVYAPGSALNVPLINSVEHYAIDNHSGNVGIVFTGNHSKENYFNFPVNNTTYEYTRSRNYANIGPAGPEESKQNSVLDISSGILSVPNTTFLSLEDPNPGRTISEIRDGNIGQQLTIYNSSQAQKIAHSTALRTKGQTTLTLPNKGSITFVRRFGFWQEISRNFDLSGTSTFDPPSIPAGGQATTTILVYYCNLGDFANVSFSNSLGGLTARAYVSAANTVTVVFTNNTASAIDLSSGTLKVRVD